MRARKLELVQSIRGPATRKSVRGGCIGFPDQPRSPLNVRPFNVSVGRIENFLNVYLPWGHGVLPAPELSTPSFEGLAV